VCSGERRERAEARQNRLADGITMFAGSMLSVYVHVICFGCWIGFGVEDYPYGLLTMIVSLEAIFLSTFALISQNRADARRQVITDQQWQTVREEAEQNVELLDLLRQILTLTKEVHVIARSLADSSWGCPVPSVPRLVPPGASKPLRGTPLPGALRIECRVLETNWSRTWVAGVV
jgi:uncharacterized membrane protein